MHYTNVVTLKKKVFFKYIFFVCTSNYIVTSLAFIEAIIT